MAIAEEGAQLLRLKLPSGPFAPRTHTAPNIHTKVKAAEARVPCGLQDSNTCLICAPQHQLQLRHRHAEHLHHRRSCAEHQLPSKGRPTDDSAQEPYTIHGLAHSAQQDATNSESSTSPKAEQDGNKSHRNIPVAAR